MLKEIDANDSNVCYHKMLKGHDVDVSVPVDGRFNIDVEINGVLVGAIDAVELLDKQQEDPDYTLSDAVEDFLWNTNVMHDVCCRDLS